MQLVETGQRPQHRGGHGRGIIAGRLRLQILPNRKQETLEPFVQKNVKPGSDMRTDGWGGYENLGKLGYRHEAEQIKGDHSKADQHLPMIHIEKGIHPQMDPAVQSLLQHHNISREENEERGDWREDMDKLPDHQYEKDQADVVYFVGCVASFFPMVQNIPQNMVTILSAADVDFTILAGEEWCCGFPLAGAGAERHMEKFISNLPAKF